MLEFEHTLLWQAHISELNFHSLCISAGLYAIIDKPDCTADDAEKFSLTLDYLSTNHGYTLKTAKSSLLHRCAQV